MTKTVNPESNQESDSEPEMPRNEYEVFMFNDAAGAEETRDIFWSERDRALLSGLTARQGNGNVVQQQFSARFVMEQSTSRYFALIAEALNSMEDMFTEKDIAVIMNTSCVEVWDWKPRKSVAALVTDSAGIEDA